MHLWVFALKGMNAKKEALLLCQVMEYAHQVVIANKVCLLKDHVLLDLLTIDLVLKTVVTVLRALKDIFVKEMKKIY